MNKFLDKLGSGWKTYAGAGLMAFGALNGVFHIVSPETMAAIVALGLSLGVVGLRHAMTK